MLPSIKTLSIVFGAESKRARTILEMKRAQLEELPACEARIRECYHAPDTYDLRMTALDELAGTHGVEWIRTRAGYCVYLNSGDTYTKTLMKFRGRYIVSDCGTILERHGEE
jgi:hypothetical protein